MTKLLVLPLLFTAACALETPAEPETASTDQDLTGQEVDSSWFTDAGFTHQVGESDLYCTAGKYQQGTINTKFVARFYWPCNGAGGYTVRCFAVTLPGQYGQVECPAGLF